MRLTISSLFILAYAVTYLAVGIGLCLCKSLAWRFVLFGLLVLGKVYFVWFVIRLIRAAEWLLRMKMEALG